MKLFIKDHLSLISLYIIIIFILPLSIEKLDGFKNHYIYYILLSVVLLITVLVIRYFRRRKIYINLLKPDNNENTLYIDKPVSPLEKAYARQLNHLTLLLKQKEEHHNLFLQEQQLLISHAVHQMKIPISVIQLIVQSQIINNIECLKWQQIKVQCDKLNFSLNQLQSFSRSSNLLADLKFEKIFLKKSVQEVINDLKEYFIEKDVFPKIAIPDNIIIYSDKKWIKVVLYQILSNAIKYGEKNSKADIQLNNCTLIIKNRGETIPTNEINRIFDLFYTGSLGRQYGEATGIGLFLVKKILDTLDYPYKIESCNSETSFSIDLSNNIKIEA